MKKTTFLLAIVIICWQNTFSQNVGIGTTTPLARLDIDGDIAMRSSNITISTTYNYALDVNTVKQGNYKLLQSVPIIGNFIIAGITGGVEGRIITLANRSGYSLEIYNNDPIATSTNRIMTGTGNTFVIFNGGSVTLKYDAATQRWEVINSHYNNLDYFGGGSGTSYWDLSGSNISNTNTGNVGIKTSVSNASLSVGRGAGPDGTAAFFGTTNVSHFNYGNTEDTYIRGGKDGSKVIINDGPLFGNVGIGLNNPRCRLSILSNSSLGNGNTEVLQIAGKNAMTIFSNQNGSDFGYLKAVTDNSLSPQLPRTGMEIGAGGGNIYLTSLGYQPALTVNGIANNVGIGLTSPRCRLSILSNNVLPNSNTEVLQIAGKNAMTIFSDENGADYGYIKAVTDNTQTPDYSRAGLLMGVSTGNLYLSTNYVPVLTINGLTNNVGIGTINPTQKLSVNGTIRSKEIIVETGWADYVFDEKYQLPSLDSVANHIQTYKHLPGMPSAKEINVNGLKVGEIQTKMMEKIEELTLYVIELKKEIELLKLKNL